MSDGKNYYMCVDCKKPYDDDARKPLLLPCGHACCRACASRMEDRSDTACPYKKCKLDWSSKNLSDLKVVFDLIPGKPGSSGTRDVTPAPSSAGACKMAAAVTSGREIEPMEEEDANSDDCFSVASYGERKALSVTDCPLCMDEYNGNESRPVLLTCGHASCLACLETLEKGGSVQCPRCRKMWPKGALKNLPVVKTLVRPINWNKMNPHKKVSPFSVTKRAEELRAGWEHHDALKKNEVEVYVESGGRTRTVHVDLDRDTVEDITQKLPGRSNSCMRYVYNGRTVQNKSRLAALNLKPYSTIREAPRLTGGSSV
ncbi:Zinc finger RING-type [Trinorchestia longiramus]|nr:Zinc finger RING-type [Trinorchestia longiramus]